MNANLKTARFAGLMYLTIFIAGIFAEFFVRSSLIVPTDAATTAANIMAAESLFRSGIMADLVMIMADVTLALAFYVLLKPVNHTLALLAAFFRLGQATILGLNLLNLIVALQLLTGAGDLAAFTVNQQQAQALLFLNAHGFGYTLGMMFFAFNCLVTGYLVFRSGYFPRLLGVLLIIAAGGYLIDSSAQFMLANYPAIEETMSMVVFMPAFVGELAMCLWLLIRGVNTTALQERLALNTAQVEGSPA